MWVTIANPAGGYSKKLGWSPEQYNQAELRMGMIAELEHTSAPAEAQKIAMDHLAEQVLNQQDQDYYTRLAAMEAGMESNRDETERDLVLPQRLGLEVAEFNQGPGTPTGALLAVALDYEPVSRAMVLAAAGELQELNLRLNSPRLDCLVTDLRAFAANPEPEYQIGAGAPAAMAANLETERLMDDENLLRDVRLEAQEGSVFRLRLWDTNTRDSMGKWVLGYRFEQTEPEAQAMVLFEGEDFGSSPLHAIDADETVRSLLSFLTLRPGDTDAEYFEGYNADQRDFAQTDAEALQLCSFGPDELEGEEPYPLNDWED